jgi:hypothetical protein
MRREADTYPLDSADPTPDLVAMSPRPTRVDPPWYTPTIPKSLVAIDFYECACGTHVWRSADDMIREYGEGAYHYCPQEESSSLSDLADDLQAAQEARRDATQADASPVAVEDDDDALRGL